MEELIKKLNKEGIQYKRNIHKVWAEFNNLPDEVKKKLHMTGRLLEKWQVMVGDLSIIKGGVAFGMYEALNSKTMKDPERFGTADEVIKFIRDNPKLL